MMKHASGILVLSVFLGLAGCDEQGENGTMAASNDGSPKTAEIVLVSMAGWTQSADTMASIEQSMIRSLSGCFPNHRITVKRRLLGLLPEGDSELFLGLEYEAWKQKKNTPAGKNDMFVAVGHSSGATAIYSLMKNGTFKSGKDAPAFLGLVDMVLPLGPHDLTGSIPSNGGRRTVVVHYHLYETDDIGGIPNIIVRGDHFSIITSGIVIRGLAGNAVNACSIQQYIGRDNAGQLAVEENGRWE
jgi:hypothetical protein